MESQVERNQTLRQVNLIRFALPIILFVIVSSYETWEHWILFDLPPVDEIAEGVRDLGTPGVNSWRRIGYGGPCPPSGIHRYLFRVFALDDTLRLPERSGKAEVFAAMEGHVLGEAVLMGRHGK